MKLHFESSGRNIFIQPFGYAQNRGDATLCSSVNRDLPHRQMSWSTRGIVHRGCVEPESDLKSTFEGIADLHEAILKIR